MKKVVCLCILLTSIRASAETLAETVARYEKMGMPNVAGAEFTDIGLSCSHSIEDLGGAGNAWKLSEEMLADGTRTALFVVEGGATIRALWPDKRHRWSRNSTELISSWERARLKRAIAQIMQTVSQHDSEALQDYKKRTPAGSRDIELLMALHQRQVNPGIPFLFALQLHQHGETEAAEALARLIREKFDDGTLEKAARIALSQALYKTAFWDFIRHRDWERFHADLQKVLRDAPEKWDWLPVLRDMAARVHAIVFDGGTPLPAGYSFSEKEKALVRAWEAFPEFRVSSMGDFMEGHRYSERQTLWLIPEDWKDRISFDSDAERNIRLMGMNAIPMLVALCEEPAAKTEKPQLPHPITRSEKARKMLLDILPYAMVDITFDRSTSPIGEVATAFYEKHKDATPAALAILYSLNQDYHPNSFNKSAFGFFRRLAHRQPIPELETFFTTIPIKVRLNDIWSIQEMAELVVYYAACRGPGHEKIIADFAARVDAAADAYAKGLDPENPDEERRKYEQKFLPQLYDIGKKLCTLNFSASDEALWDTYKGDNAGYVKTMLTVRLDTLPFKDVYLEVLRHVQPDNPVRYVDLLYQYLQNEGGVEKVKSLIQPTDGRDDWRRILQGETGTHGLDFYIRIFEERALLDYRRKTTGARGITFLRKRALARLDGVPDDQLPKFPWEEEAPNAEQCAAIAQRFADVQTRQDAAQTLAQLSESERSVFSEICAEHPALMRKLSDVSREIIDVSCTVADGDAFKSWRGTPMSPERVSALQQFCEEHMKQNIPVVCIAERKDSFGGWIITVAPLDNARNCNAGYTGLACETGSVAGFVPLTIPPKSYYHTYKSDRPAFDKLADAIVTGSPHTHAAALIKFATAETYGTATPEEGDADDDD